MIINKSRRHFMVGTGGTLLALPVLPSLYATDAQAQTAAQQRFFAHFGMEHGGIDQARMFPAASTITDRMTYAGFEVRRGPLAATVSNGQASVSPVLTGPASSLTPAMVAKMNVCNGIGNPWYTGHNRSQALGNFAEADQVDPYLLANGWRMTIDQIMANSSSFYKRNVQQRSIEISTGSNGGAFGWSSPSTRSGTLQRLPDTSANSLALFDKLFPASGTGPVSTRPLLVDSMVESYRRMRDGTGRLSTADKQRIADHLDQLAQLQAKLVALAPVGPPPRPAKDNYFIIYTPDYYINPAKQIESEGLWNDVVVAAFASGVSAVHTRRTPVPFSNYTGAWHQDIVHQSSIPEHQDMMDTACQMHFSNVFLDFATKLNAISNGVGGTLLDNSLVAWSHESGNFTHDSNCVPIITFGSAGGFLRTGSYVDYRALNKRTNSPGEMWYGLLMHQWCNTALMAMGIPKSEFENAAVTPGYPDFKYVDTDVTRTAAFTSEVWNAAGDVLPWLKA